MNNYESNHQGISDIEVIRLPSFFSAMDSVGADFCAALLKTLEARNSEGSPRESAILLVQIENRPSSGNWLCELRDGLFHYDLSLRIALFRRLLTAVRSSRIPVFMAYWQDCVDDHWELALACRAIIATNLSGSIGFPSIGAGIFPVGGTFDRPRKARPWTKERGLMFQSMRSHEGFYDGSVTIWGKCANPEEFAKSWIRRNGLAFRTAETPQQSIGEFWEQKEVAENWSQTHREIAGARSHERARTTAASSWDVCWKILESRPRSQSATSRDLRLFWQFTGQFYSSRYLGYLQNQVLGNGRNYLSISAAGGSSHDSVVLDLTSGLLPLGLMIHLLFGGRTIHVVAADGKILVNILEKLFQFLEKMVSPARAQEIWHQSVFWHVGSSGPEGCLRIDGQHDDSLVLRIRDRPVTVYSAQTNSLDAMFGPFEFVLGPNDGDELRGLLRGLLGPKVIFSTGVTSLKVPAVTWLRSLMLDEMIVIAKYLSRDVDGVVRGLGEFGWGFAADEHAWDRFLRNRYSLWPTLDRSDPIVTEFGPRVEAWNHLAVRQIRGLERRVSGKSPAWNMASASRHLAIYSGVLSRLLVELAITENLELADELCAAAIGYPESLERPSHLLAGENRRRLRGTFASHWPQALKIESFKMYT